MIYQRIRHRIVPVPVTHEVSNSVNHHVDHLAGDAEIHLPTHYHWSKRFPISKLCRRHIINNRVEGAFNFDIMSSERSQQLLKNL